MLASYFLVHLIVTYQLTPALERQQIAQPHWFTLSTINPPCLSYHNRGRSNVSPGQLSLFPNDGIDWDIIAPAGEPVRGNLSDRYPQPLV